MKKTFIIISVLFGFTLFFWGVYNFAFKKSVPGGKNAVSQNDPKVAEDFLAAKKQQGKVYAITEGKVLAPVFVKKDNKIIYYSKADGTTWRMDPDGKNSEQISTKKLDGLKDVIWSSDRGKVISQFEKDGTQSYFVYDYNQNESIKINKNADLIVWDNLGAKIVYKYFDQKTNKRSLNIADQDGSNWKSILDELPFRKISIKAVPQTSLISFWNVPNIQEETKLQVVSAVGGEAKTIFSGKFGADYLWSPSGEKALVSFFETKNDRKIYLGIVDISGKYEDLGVPTFVQKCAWSQDKKSIFCALPGGIPENAILPNDYEENKFNTKDTFWKIDTTSGKKERILDLEEIKEGYDAVNLFLSSNEDALFFTNKTDGRLYRIDL